LINRKPFLVRILHWSVVILFLVALTTGYTAFDFGLEMKIGTRDALFAIHRLSGVATGFLILIWGISRIPALITAALAMRCWSAIAVYHLCLGVLCFLLPAFPWLARSLDGRIQELYSIFPAYNLVSPPTTLLAYWMFQQHRNIVNYVLILVALHLAGVLYHRYLRRDDVLSTMLFARRERSKR
jgi:cytochrome b561